MSVDVQKLRELVAFLDGSGEMDGASFGDRIPGVPPYWWRKELPKITSLLDEVERLRSQARLLDRDRIDLQASINTRDGIICDMKDDVERLRAACGQASFCLRELLPNDADAQMTVRTIDAALGASK